MKKILFILGIIILIHACEKSNIEKMKDSENITIKKNQSDTLHIDDSEKSEVIKYVSDDNVINNIIFQKKIKFLPIYVNRDEFGNVLYGLSSIGVRANQTNNDIEYFEGKFQKNNVFMELDFINRMISQKYTIDIPEKKLIIYKKKYNYDNILEDRPILNMHIFLLDYGLLCVDRNIKPTSKYGTYCGIFIADNLDEKIIMNYPQYVTNQFNEINNN